MFMLAAAVCSADVLYSNTTNDQQTSVFFSTGYTQIGDEILLPFSSGLLSSVDAQFYNVGTDATFDAVLSFYDPGTPVGSQIGSSFTETNISIPGSTSETVTFSNLGGLLIPSDVIVMLAVQNVSTGGDIGVNLFDPPGVGTSDNSFFITNDGTGFSQTSTNLNIDNLYFELDGTGTPEPSTVGLTLGGLALLAYRKLRRA